GGERVRHGGEAPQRDGDRIADLRAVAIDEPAEEKQSDRVRPLERRVDQAELFVRPAQFTIEKLLDQGQDLAVDVINGCGEEEKGADDPANAARHFAATSSSSRHTRPAGESDASSDPRLLVML